MFLNRNILYFSLLVLIFNTHWSNGYLYPIEYRIPVPGQVPAPGTPWPLPLIWQNDTLLLTLDPEEFDFDSNMKNCDIITNAMKRYRDLLFIDKKSVKSKTEKNVLEVLHISVKNNALTDCGYPHHNPDESYGISISSQLTSATINATTVWGALRGLETFSQLVYVKEPTKEVLINFTNIYDKPRYSYRGMHMDTARHFIPKHIILANLDAMAYNKFNAFHWHIVDDQSFPFESKLYPNLTEKGAFSPKHVYTQEDVKEIIEYSRLRGIRVIPEVDSPGHTHGIGRAFPDLLTPCWKDGKPNTPDYPNHSATELLNPMLEKTFDFMTKLFKEFKGVFKDDYIHLGMDEVNYACWNSSPEIAKFMQDNKWDKLHQVEEYYINRTLKNVKSINYKYIMWQDPVDNGATLADDSIVMVWKDKSLDPDMGHWEDYIANIAKKGHTIVLNACWYLNYIAYPYPNNGENKHTWENFYLCDPRNFTGTEAEKDLVIGGEVCLWVEFADATNILSRLWPRASSVAERLWSKREDTLDVDNARQRLDQHRCRMVRRGIPAAPILNGYCGDYEWGMDSPGAGNQIKICLTLLTLTTIYSVLKQLF